jgi:predicted DNA-binding transcriptional regulator AlpA
MISDSFGPIIHSHGLRFLDTPSMRAERARCLYIRTPTAKWRRDNPDSWRILTLAEQTALTLRTEDANAALSAVPLPSRTAVSVPPQTEGRLPEDERSARAMPSVLTKFPLPSARKEIIIDGRPLLNQKDAATILGVALRTLQRWNEDNYGPAQIKIGRRVYYDPRDVTAWVRGNRTVARQPGLPTEPQP